MMPAAHRQAEDREYVAAVRALAEHCARLSGASEPEYQSVAMAFKALHRGTVWSWRRALWWSYVWADRHAGEIDWPALARLSADAR